MLVIQNIEYSKRPVNTNETFIMSVTIEEVMATWGNQLNKSWDISLDESWILTKTRPVNLQTWSTTKDKVWGSIPINSWKNIKLTNL
ncbi:MAG: hypothetical protein K0S61_124 [Anaerocolumna sp.]|jgi:hypothetical protein|nr:hypothetical protein [Anaerocolumna sp.]